MTSSQSQNQSWRLLPALRARGASLCSLGLLDPLKIGTVTTWQSLGAKTPWGCGSEAAGR